MSGNAGQSHDSIIRKPVLTEKEASFRERLFHKQKMHGEQQPQQAVQAPKNAQVEKQLDSFMNEMANTLKKTATGRSD